MFTGLIEEMGTICSLKKDGSNLHLEISCSKVLEDIHLGDSISIDGACQTVISISDRSFTVTAIQETLNLTNFNSFVVGSKVNLERCLRASDRLGGHIVQGHVDGIGLVTEIKTVGEASVIPANSSVIPANAGISSWQIFVRVPDNLSKYIIHKGSITLSGISLTVASIDDCIISVCIIPETWTKTNLANLVPGSKVNVEVDVLAKYVERLWVSKNHPSRHCSTSSAN